MFYRVYYFFLIVLGMLQQTFSIRQLLYINRLYFVIGRRPDGKIQSVITFSTFICNEVYVNFFRSSVKLTNLFSYDLFNLETYYVLFLNRETFSLLYEVVSFPSRPPRSSRKGSSCRNGENEAKKVCRFRQMATIPLVYKKLH